jgi:hypothetical protein
MAAQALPRDNIAFGRAVLLATDALGMSAEGAFWIHDPKDDQWRYFLVTSLFDKLGPREMFLRLNDALTRMLSEREMQEFTLYLASPSEKFIRSVRAQVSTMAHASEPKMARVKIAARRVPAWIYRLASEGDAQQIKLSQRRFRRLCAELQPA